MSSHETPGVESPTAGELDTVVEQLAAVCTAGHAFLCRLASPARLAVNRPSCPCLAHTPWPGQTAPAGRPGSLARSVGGHQCAALGRYLKPLRGLSAHDPACTAFKLVGLLDLRAQRWLRLQWREAVHENCRVDMLDAPRKDSGRGVGCSSIWALSAISLL
jgi:hypothetical protein